MRFKTSRTYQSVLFAPGWTHLKYPSYLIVGRRARIPDHELLVVGDGAEEGLVQQMPRHVLHHGSVAGEDRLGVNHLELNGNGLESSL